MLFFPASAHSLHDTKQRLHSFLASLLRFRNLEFLEAELQEYYEEEQKTMEMQEKKLKKMQKKLA